MTDYSNKAKYSPEAEQRIVKRFIELRNTHTKGDLKEFAAGYGVSYEWMRRRAKKYG